VVDCLTLIAEEVVPALERAAAASGAIAVPA